MFLFPVQFLYLESSGHLCLYVCRQSGDRLDLAAPKLEGKCGFSLPPAAREQDMGAELMKEKAIG